MATLNNLAVYLTQTRWANTAAFAFKQKHRRRFQLKRLYELSGDFRSVVDMPVEPVSQSELLEKAEMPPRISFGNLIAPSFLIGAAAATFFVTKNGFAAVSLVMGSGLFLAAADSKRTAGPDQTAKFLADYPTVLMAMTAEIKSGLSPLSALERAVRVLEPKNVLRKEALLMTAAIRRGVSQEIAVEKFAEKFDLPELDLFRSAFLLALAKGEKFFPPLERLAVMSRERCGVIQFAGVSTRTIKRAANLILVIIFAVVGLTLLGYQQYLQLVRELSLAAVLINAGIALLAFSYLMLLKLGDFKP